MKIAFVYAGQGSQYVGMGKDIYESYSLFQQVFDNAEVDFDIKKLCFEGPEETLKKTSFTQPAMVAFAVGVTDILYSENIKPDYVCGLSLGEYSALYAASVFDKKTVIDVASFRGKAMEKAAMGVNSSMVAVLGLEADAIKKACERVNDIGVAQVANYNCPGQIVIGGESEAVLKASEFCKEYGAKRCIPLKVSGPFHTSFMAPAGDALGEKFDNIKFCDMKIPVVFNATGKEMKTNEDVSSLLQKQVQSSVYFEQSVRFLKNKGVDTIVEIGPGKVLSGFIKKIDKDLKIYNIDSIESLQNVILSLKEKNNDIEG